MRSDGDAGVLSDIDLVVPAGTATAIAGATGPGKSTLGSLVPRLHETRTGRVTIDGVDVRDLSPADLPRIVGVVSQESYLLHASIRENLLVADPEVDEDTLVGARGHRFSGGEQQRLDIAGRSRALVDGLLLKINW